MPGETGDFLRPHMSVQGAGLCYCAETDQLSHRKEARLFLLCLCLIAKSTVTSEDFLTSGPFGLITRSFLLFLPEIVVVCSISRNLGWMNS